MAKNRFPITSPLASLLFCPTGSCAKCQELPLIVGDIFPHDTAEWEYESNFNVRFRISIAYNATYPPVDSSLSQFKADPQAPRPASDHPDPSSTNLIMVHLFHSLLGGPSDTTMPKWKWIESSHRSDIMLWHKLHPALQKTYADVLLRTVDWSSKMDQEVRRVITQPDRS